MIAWILIIIGAILILVSVIGAIILLLEPVHRNFQIVINRKDDYTHYLNPAARQMLQKAKKDYIAGLVGIFFLGLIPLMTGLYMQYGPRGLGMFFSSRLGDPGAEEAVTGGQAEGINAAGNYVAEDGTEYVYYFVIRGSRVFYRDETEMKDTGSVIRLLEEKIPKENTVYLVDGYASAAIFHEIMDCLEENGYQYKTKE